MEYPRRPLAFAPNSVSVPSAPPEIAHGVLADEAMQAWSDWRPLATQAIRLFGFFVKPKVGKINADGL